jgi:hypothetical protein
VKKEFLPATIETIVRLAGVEVEAPVMMLEVRAMTRLF